MAHCLRPGSQGWLKSTSQSLRYEMPKDGHVSIPRSVFDETVTYQVHVRGCNTLGESNSTFTFSVWDSVIPSTPEITKIAFEKSSLSPTIYWKSSEDSLKPSLRFRRAHDTQDWEKEMGTVMEFQVGSMLMQDVLNPLMPYQFELRVCVTSVNCSMWSHPYNATSPGIGKPAPIITCLTPEAGNSVYLAWDLPYYNEALIGVLGFVVQWQQSPVIRKRLQFCIPERFEATFQYTLRKPVEFLSLLLIKIMQKKRVII
ncbi:uncharacterized protein LOC127449464 isoform X2 [Myxocyprinus asiaticus]|uniref:uncharacterized protein LOC127449464 isoform X2 n=1 Tax=Myxocyprinus asiaticus TaxID=70543 RepID=UPI00222319A8|nr:uncharacterized protein LOC127449464 isoform X2 [Myxocyprinus asiaticus]